MSNSVMKGLFSLFILLCSTQLAATEVLDLYQTRALVEDQSNGKRLKGFSQGIEQVLVRVSGTKAVLDEPRLASAIVAPARYVQGFRYEKEGDQTWLITDFNRKALQSLLVEQGQPVWSASRPDTLMWVAVQERGRRYLLDGSQQRKTGELLAEQAQLRGIPLLWPLDSDLEAGVVTVADIKAGFNDQVVKASEHYGAQAVLIGLVRELQGGRWHSRWHLIRGERLNRWESEKASLPLVMETGVDVLADLMAADFAVTASDEGPQVVEVHVNGVDQLEKYAANRKYLQELLQVESLGVERVTQDTIVYKVKLRGGMEEFSRTLALEGRMKALPVPVPETPVSLPETPLAPAPAVEQQPVLDVLSLAMAPTDSSLVAEALPPVTEPVLPALYFEYIQ